MRRGPGLRLQLLFASLVLLTIPWLAWRALGAVEAFLLEGQQRAVVLTARGAATLLGERVAPYPEPALHAAPLYAWPLAEAATVDGYPGDWAGLFGQALVIHGPASDAPGAARRLELLLGTRGETLYGLARISDPQVVYRHPGIERIDRSDHLRLHLDGRAGPLRLVFAAEGPGDVRPFVADHRWQRAGAPPPTGLRAAWQPHALGYSVEFSVPLAELAPHPAAWVAVADVDDAGSRQPVALLATAGDALRPGLHPLRYRAVRLEALLGSLAGDPGRTWVTDRDGWVLASVGGGTGLSAAPERVDRLTPAPWREARAGRASVAALGRGGAAVIVAAEPLLNAGKIVGVVLTEQQVDQLLALQYRTFVELALATLGLLGVSILALLLFASRLAWRIRRLGRETGHAIDARGRLRHVRIAAEAHSADELGELSRSISELLGRLQRHTQFLRNLPRTLRHEISNPLNTIATALHNLAVETHDRERYLASAERGLTRLERILGALTEAANLDEALQQETREPLDLAALLASYLESFALLHPGLLGVRELPLDGAMLDGNAQRIEQLLDKLFDNAAGFTPPDGRVDVTLRRVGGQLVLEIANDGPPPPAAEQAALFDAMVSRRGGVPLEAPHLGIGLYVARRIVEEHGGSIRLDARPDGGGAVVTLRLPARDHA